MLPLLRRLARLALLTTAIPGAVWSIPLPVSTSTPVVTPTGNILADPCLNVTPTGGIAWSLPNNNAENSASCAAAISDSQGNSYVQTTAAPNIGAVESINPSGGIRWTTPTGSYATGRVGAGPAIGSNGSVYFSESAGGPSRVVGFDEQTGAVTFDQTFGDVTGLYTYTGGVIVVNGDSEVVYFGYDGTLQNTYHTGTPISAYEAYSNAAGASGTVFLAGYPVTCGGQVSVVKFTPAGLAWTWTDGTAYNCSQTLLAATSDGGVILARNEAAPSPSADFTSISPSGTLRWDHLASGPIGPAYSGGYLPPIVDINGVVALPSVFDSSCVTSISGVCRGAQVEFVSQQAGVQILPRLEVTDPADEGFDLYNLATDAGRVYLVGQGTVASKSLSAFGVPGLAMDYRLALQEALMSAPPAPPLNGGNTSGGSPPSGGGLSSPSKPTPVTSNPCAPVHGNAGKRLLASLKCTAELTKLEAECAFSIITFGPLKAFDAAKTAAGLYDLRKIKKKFRPIAKLYNDFKTVKVLKSAPHGFRTRAEILGKIKKAKTAWKLVRLLPDIAKAIPQSDFKEIVIDMADIAGLKPCVQGVIEALG